MNFINGNIYRIKNQYYPNHALNVYGTNAASTGRNVCLYDNTPSDIMQRWVLKTYGDGFQLCSAVNSDYVLDCSDGSLTNSYKNNAHLCKFSPKSAADNTVEFIEVSDDLYKIYLPGKNLYLTATNINRLNGLPASTIKTATALTGGTGGQSNVYWAAEATSSLATQKQCWTVELYSGSSSGGGETGEVDGIAVGSAVTTFPSNAYYSSNNASYALGTQYVGECTWYCNGRAYERKGIGNVCTRSAGKWYDSANAFSKLSSAEVPVSNSIACFDGGHVVYIEKVAVESGTTYVYFSECNWYAANSPYLSNGQIEPPPTGTDGALKKLTLSKFIGRGPGKYQGCIVI